MNRSSPGLPVYHHLPEFTQAHVHWVGDTIQPCHPLSSPSPPAPNPSQHQSLFQWVNSSHEVAKVLEFQLYISPSKEHPGLISFRMDWNRWLITVYWKHQLDASVWIFMCMVKSTHIYLAILWHVVVQSPSHIWLCHPMDCSTPGLSVPHHLTEFAQVHVHWIGDAIQPSHPLSPSSAFNLSQHQGLFQWVSSLHQVAKRLELQLQHQSFQ